MTNFDTKIRSTHVDCPECQGRGQVLDDDIVGGFSSAGSPWVEEITRYFECDICNGAGCIPAHWSDEDDL